jgi:hypothetical protein
MCALPMRWTASSLRHYTLCRGIFVVFPTIMRSHVVPKFIRKGILGLGSIYIYFLMKLN